MIKLTIERETHMNTIRLHTSIPAVTAFMGKLMTVLTAPKQGYKIEREDYDSADGWFTGFTAAKGDKRIAIRASDIQPLFEPTGDLELDTLIADYCDLGDTQPIDVQALKVAM